MTSAILGGIGWHMVGAASAASFYAPIEKVKKWSWETTWAVAGLFSWILLPLTVSFILLPNFHGFYAGIASGVLTKTFLFGCMWGVGNVNYGLTMRYLGMSLGIGVAIGVTLVVGTLVPPILHGQLGYLLSRSSGHFTMAGIVLALIGIAIVSWAGHQKEQRMGVRAQEFSLGKGLLLAVMCGIFSSGMSFAIDAAKPIAAAAEQVGVKPLYAALPSYVIIMGGGALVNFAYCFVRLAYRKDISLRLDWSQARPTLLRNISLAASGGIMWYLQFFFYAWGAANIPAHLSFVNWMLHMSGYVLFGGIVGLALGEWRGAGRRPVRLLWTGMAAIIAAANLVGLGMAS
ncbi:MAG TPA: L-rhamnose/proton symporter RhaT [Acidobacteriaceae bacterium]|jgi:L-rhamnose-H+ transport protein|nr:L-rhamnose/proton symporter RhaT [Acidobacteriaceae bacterium]